MQRFFNNSFPQNRQNSARQRVNVQNGGDYFEGNEPSGQSNRFLTVQNARADIIGELDAIIQYETHLHATTDPVARATITDIVNEEKLHVGQLFGLLFKLDPMSETQFENGLNEFHDDDQR